jgi:hypothetical protein
LEDKNEVIAIDTRALKITARWPVALAGQPVSISMDRHTGVCLSELAIRASFYHDGYRHRQDNRIILSDRCAGGYEHLRRRDWSGHVLDSIHVFHEDSADKIRLIETVKTEYGAKTMALDPKTHNLLVDTSDFETQGRSDGRQSRPAARPGTFRLLVNGQ